MRSNEPNNAGAAPNPLRASAERARNWASDRGIGLYRAIALGILAVLLATAGYAFMPGEPVSLVRLYGDRQLPQAQLDEVVGLLTQNGIRPVVEANRVKVPAASQRQSMELLRKNKLEVPSFKEILNGAVAGSILETPAEREVRLNRVRSEAIAFLIEGSDGIIKADVMINPIRSKGYSRSSTARAFVRLQTEGDAPISPRAVKRINNLLFSCADYEIPPEAVTLEGHGQSYLMAGDLSRLHRVLAQAREDELSEEIAAKLGTGGGIEVAVSHSMPSPRPREIAAAPSTAPTPPRPRNRTWINTPPEPEPEPEPTPPHTPVAEPARADGVAKVYVTVRVPKEMNGLAAEQGTHPAGSEPAVAPEIERRIQDVVAKVVPPEEFGDLSIVAIDGPGEDRPTEAIAARPRPIPPPTRTPTLAAVATETSRIETWRAHPEGLIGALSAVAALALLALAVAGGRQVAAGRRRSPAPTTRVVGPASHENYDGDDAPGAGHVVSDRVRDLVRRNPEAAAGVLHRWVGQGGRAA